MIIAAVWQSGQAEGSIFKPKTDESPLKNSQVLLSKVQAKGALGMGRKYAQGPSAQTQQLEMSSIFKKKQQAK